MFATSLALGWRLGIYFVAGVVAGISNGIAGGGTFFAFPTMLAMGLSALTANVTTTVAVVPSFFGNLRGLSGKFAAHRKLLRPLVPIAVVGTLSGCTLLLEGSPTTFEHVVPWLIGGATALFAAAPYLTRRLAHLDHHHPARRGGLYVGIGLIALYGGYFGAGIGIMLLAVTALTLPLEIHELQTLRSLISIVISAVAALVFIVRGHLALGALYPMLAGTLIGGWLGAIVITRLSAKWVRALIITTGLVTTLKLLLQY
jgi:uncharacterized protein